MLYYLQSVSCSMVRVHHHAIKEGRRKVKARERGGGGWREEEKKRRRDRKWEWEGEGTTVHQLQYCTPRIH